jgi:ABC-type proline/glycine betaine transport system permease subunit
MADTKTILAGAVPAAIMAIVADEVLEWVERRFSY